MSTSAFRSLPPAHALTDAPALVATGAPHALRVDAARAVLAEARAAIADGAAAPPHDALAALAARRLREWLSPRLRRAVNATGVVIHTNLGRAPLPPGALDEALGYCNLELDLATGRRGSRRALAGPLLEAMTGAEAALVVNNNAAAVVLMLTALAAGREVVISRGELVEIGGSFRVPDIMEASGARLREVGTTNKTHLHDYARAIGPDTAAVLRVHPSNFRVVGFVARPSDADLAALAHDRGLPLLHDLGSAALGPLPAALGPDLLADADPRRALSAGADLVCFSGDKLLGGPQAGVVLGRRDLVDRLARHPLARAFRADKLTLAALEHVLLAYRAGRPDDVPVSAMLNATADALTARAEALAARLAAAGVSTRVAPSDDPIGGGSLPETTLPGAAVALQVPSPGAFADRLRAAQVPVVAVVRDDAVWLHVRTLLPGDELLVEQAVRATAAAGPDAPDEAMDA